MPAPVPVLDDGDPDGRIDGPGGAGGVLWSASGDGMRVWVDGVGRAGGLAAAESALGLFAAERLAGVVAVHAAVLVVDGGAVVLPGASHSGKSTLCAAALDLGVAVWSDEYALVGADGWVSGWERPVRLRTASGVVRRALGSSLPSAPAVPVLVASLHHSRLGWDVVTATEAEAVESLLSNTVCARRRPEASFTAAVSVASTAVRLRGTRGEADEAVERLCAVLGARVTGGRQLASEPP